MACVPVAVGGADAGGTSAHANSAPARTRRWISADTANARASLRLRATYERPPRLHLRWGCPHAALNPARKRSETRAHGVLARIHRRVRAGALLACALVPPASAPPRNRHACYAKPAVSAPARWECPHAALIPLAALCAEDIWIWRQRVRGESRSRCSCMLLSCLPASPYTGLSDACVIVT